VTRKVLFCTQTAFVWGGLEVWLDEIVPFLEIRGWEVIVGLARGRRFHDPAAYREAHPDLRTVEIDGRFGTREARVAALRHTIRNVRPDVVIPINIADALEAVAREKLSGCDVRLLVMLRAIWPHGELEDIRRFREFIDVAVGGNRLRRELIRTWAKFPENRLRFIPTGSRRRTSSARAPSTSGRIRIGYIGRLEHTEKRVLDLAGVADALDRKGVDYELTVVGDGPARSALEEALRGRARLTGKLPVDALYETILPSLDALLLFSTAEAGPQVVWQAMHHGVVAVVSAYRGLAAEGTLRHGQTAMVFPLGDVEAAASCIASLAQNRRLLNAIAAAAEKEVDPRYILDHSFEEWLRALEDAVSLPCAVGQELPFRPPSGTLERWRLPAWLAYTVRRVSGRLPKPVDPGDEWPHFGSIDPESVRQIEELNVELDRN
jgi:glycosyltransferase involved in cell wall biosynthesis